MKILTSFLLPLLVAGSITAQVTPASPFTDHMVLQRGALIPVWGTATPGEKVTVTFLKQTITATAAPDGRWMVKLDKLMAGGPFTLTIKGKNTITFTDVYTGDVWLCSGQSNMDMTVAREDRSWCGVYNEAEELANASYPLIRVFDTDFTPSNEIKTTVAGKWEVCAPATVGHFSAAAYFFARELYKKYKVPIGLVTTAYGASTVEAWTSKKALEQNPLFAGVLEAYVQRRVAYDTSITAIEKYKAAYARYQIDSAAAKAAGATAPKEPKNPDPVRDQHNPYVLYNGMVAPLIPYAIKGAIWYQGESNIPTKDIYDRLMEALVKNWREDWAQGDFPFIYVQLANYGKTMDTIPGTGGGTTYIRDKQLKNLSIPNSAMVVAIDNADKPSNIHPKNKQAIGLRLALAAEALVYNEKIPYSGPIYDKMDVKGNTIRVQFTNTDGGLTTKDGKTVGFAIAGGDKKFVWADAKIDGNTVVLSSPEVPNPVAVRYAWGDNPVISLYNKADLPASPFRTDNW